LAGAALGSAAGVVVVVAAAAEGPGLWDQFHGHAV